MKSRVGLITCLITVAVLVAWIFTGCGDGGTSGGPLRTDSSLVIGLTVSETAGIGREGEMVHNGIPIGRDENIRSIDSLMIRDESGTPVPAQFEVLSRWAGPLTGDSPIQWLLVTFPATLAAGESRSFTLEYGENVPASSPLQISGDPTELVVKTGTARFSISREEFSLFRELAIQGNPIPVQPGQGRLLVEGVGMSAGPPEAVTIEHEGPLFVTVKVEGHYDTLVKGGVYPRYVARYHFFAGSSTCQLDYSFTWPASVNGTASKSGLNFQGDPNNELLVERATLSLPLSLPSPWEGYAGTDTSPGNSAPLSVGKTAEITQFRRADISAPPVYSARVGDFPPWNGGFAERPFVAVRGETGGVGISLRKMKYREPQSLEAGTGGFEIRLVNEPQYLGPHMGAVTRVAVSLLTKSEDWEKVRGKTTAALDHPLMAWRSRKAVSLGGAMGELWDGEGDTPEGDGAHYDQVIRTVSSNTISEVEQKGMYGFMTWGLVPRNWSLHNYEVVDFGPDAFTTWDGYFHGARFADYHHAFANPARLFGMTGDPELLFDLSFPAARRMLWSMIIQVEPGDPEAVAFGYGGWAPLGYQGYRMDFNSSHSYFENLFYYYYLTGDRAVLDTLRQAGENQRIRYSRYADGTLVPPSEPAIKPWSTTSGRTASQKANTWWFLGHATEDFTFIEDYRNRLDRQMARHLALLISDGSDGFGVPGEEYAFISDADLGDDPGTLTTTILWQLTLNDFNDHWKYYREYGDQPDPVFGITLERLLLAVYNTLRDYVVWVHPGDAQHPPGDGTMEGTWSKRLNAEWTGSRIGGTLLAGGTGPQGGVDYFYEGDKASFPSVLFRAAALDDENPVVREMGLDAFRSFCGSYDATMMTWDKRSSMYWIRSHPAIYHLLK